jgi:hypothetical protein
MTTRRNFLLGAISERLGRLPLMRLGIVASAAARAVQARADSESRDLTITLSVDSSAITFSDREGIDVGDYVGEFVHQRCRMVVKDNWRVFFRPDADGSRDEVVVEYGNPFVGPVKHLTTPYVATIAKQGVALYSVTVPCHWWGGRWRWQSAPRPVVREPGTLRMRKWIPNFGQAGLFGLPQPISSLQWQGPMTPLVGVDPAMGTGGDHDQIGYLTEHAADYMIRPADSTLASLRAEGEWIANACIHHRNDDGSLLGIVSGKLDYVSYKGTILNPANPKATTAPSFIYPEVSHTYPCATAGWLLTDDPYLLEELQFMCNWVLLQYQWAKHPGVLPYGQTRAFAWGLRDLFVAAATTPPNVPKWLLPPHYFKASLDANHAWAMRYVDAPARVHSYFRAWSRSDMIAGWMSAWLTAVVGMGVEMGFAEWRPVFDWSVDMQIQMTNGTSGWNRQMPAPYYWYPNRKAVPFSQVCDVSADATTCEDWGDAWAFFASGSGGRTAVLDTSTWDGHSFISRNAVYQQHLRSALAIAVTLGTPGAHACYDYVHGECAALNVRTRHYGQARFSVEPDGTLMPALVTDRKPVEPSWLPQPGHYADIPTVNLPQDVKPAYYQASADKIFVNWSGGSYVADFSPLGAMVYEGGGHGSTQTSGIVDGKLILDLSTLTWSFVGAASRLFNEPNSKDRPPSFTSTDEYGQRIGELNGIVSVFAPHTVYGCQTFPKAWGGGPKGSVVRLGFAGADYLYNALWATDLSVAVGGWKKLVPIVQVASTGAVSTKGVYATTAIDESRQGWWCGTHNAPWLVFVGKDGTVTTYERAGMNVLGNVPFTRDPNRDKLVRTQIVAVDQPLKIYELDCKNPNAGWIAKSLVPDPATIADRMQLPGYGRNPYGRTQMVNNFGPCGLEWSTLLGGFAIFQDGTCLGSHSGPPVDMPHVWVLTYDSSGDNYDIRRETLQPAPGTAGVAYAGTPAAQVYNGAFNKFREVPALRCFIWAAAADKKPQAFRLRGM